MEEGKELKYKVPLYRGDEDGGRTGREGGGVGQGNKKKDGPAFEVVGTSRTGRVDYPSRPPHLLCRNPGTSTSHLRVRLDWTPPSEFRRSVFRPITPSNP